MNYIYSLLCRQNCRVKCCSYCNETRFHSAAISLSWPSSRWIRSSSSSASRRPPANSRMGHAASYYKGSKYFFKSQILLRRRDEWENRVHKTNASIKLQWKLCFECWVRTRTISKHKQRPQTSGKPRYPPACFPLTASLIIAPPRGESAVHHFNCCRVWRGRGGGGAGGWPLETGTSTKLSPAPTCRHPPSCTSGH